MKVFVWEYLSEATDSYHSGGGLVVFAESEKRARELATTVGGCVIPADQAPDDVRDVDGGIENFYLFPDSGCC